MPYIVPSRRIALDNGDAPAAAGELNYVITKKLLAEAPVREIRALVDAYVAARGLSYSVANDVVGALGCARREFKRRQRIDLTFLRDIADRFYDGVVAPYEDKKIQENGDVYNVNS